MNDKYVFPVDLTPLGNPLKFLKKQCQGPFKMKNFPFIRCNADHKCLPMLREHCRLEFQHDACEDSKGPVRKISKKFSFKQNLCTNVCQLEKHACKTCDIVFTDKDSLRDYHHQHHSIVNYNDSVNDPGSKHKCTVPYCGEWIKNNEISIDSHNKC